MTHEAWYLRCTPEDVGQHAVLVGDRGRVLLAAEMLDDAVILNEDRGLTTATGFYRGVKITVCAFGMGAPIAAIVMHELSDLGVTQFVRLGTALTIGDTEMGELVLAHGAVRYESTSATYLPLEYPAVPNYPLTQALAEAAATSSSPTRSGLYASFDGFYTQMFDANESSTSARDRLAELAKNGVVAADMETSALLVAARALGVSAASLCLASVDGATRKRMAQAPRLVAEAELLRVGFDALASLATAATATA